MGEAMDSLLAYRPPTGLHRRRDNASRLLGLLERVSAGKPVVSCNDPDRWIRHYAGNLGLRAVPTVEEARSLYADLQQRVLLEHEGYEPDAATRLTAELLASLAD